MTKAKVHALPRRRAGCPVCGKPASTAATPFCSTRCRDVDLARWFGEAYAIPAVEVDDSDLDDPAGTRDED